MVGIVGPNGAGKTSLFGLISGDLAPDAGRGPLRRAHGHQAGRGRPVPAGHRPHLPGAAAVRGHDGVREPARRRPAGRRAAAPGQLRGGGRGAGADRHVRRRRTCPPSGSACCSASGWSWPGRWPPGRTLLLLDEVAGGLTDPEVAQLVEIVRGINAEGIAVIWIEHVVRALTAVVSRLICLAGGAFVGDGEPAAVLANPAVREVFLGTEVTAALAGGSLAQPAARRRRRRARTERAVTARAAATGQTAARRCWRSGTWSCTTASCGPWTRSRCGCSPARSTRSSARTARASRRCCARSPACTSPTAGSVLFDGQT